MFGYLPGPYSESWLKSWYIFGYSAAKLEMQPAAARSREVCPQPLAAIVGRVFRNIVIQNSAKRFLLTPAFFLITPWWVNVRRCSPMFADVRHLPKPGSTPVEDHQIKI